MAVIQEWGINDQIKGAADKPATAGYRALVPDLYRGKVALEANESEHLMTRLSFAARIDRRRHGSAHATVPCAQSSSSRISLRRQNHGFQGGSYRAQTAAPCHLTPAVAKASCNFFRFSS